MPNNNTAVEPVIKSKAKFDYWLRHCGNLRSLNAFIRTKNNSKTYHYISFLFVLALKQWNYNVIVIILARLEVIFGIFSDTRQ